MNKVKKIFITGGGGYIGGALISSLLKEGLEVVCYDLLLYGDESIKKFLEKKNFRFIQGDIRNVKKIEDSMDGSDAVIHLAAIVGDKPCEVLGNLSYDINFNGTKLLAEIAKKKKIKKFIFSSTCSNYGISDPGIYINEEGKLNPVSLYAEAKVDCERHLMKMADDNFNPICFRIATIYGVAERIRFDLTVNSFTYEACNEKKLSVFSSDTWRPYAHVKDIAKIIQISLTREIPHKGVIYNAGYTKENYTKKNIVEKLQKLIPSLEVTYVNLHDDRRNYKVDFAKIEKELKIVNNYSVEDGMKEIIKLYENKKINSALFKSNNLEGVINFYKKNIANL